MARVSPKDVEVYIYSMVVMKLQNLAVDPIFTDSPIPGLEIVTSRTSMNHLGAMPHRYQREMAQADRNHLVIGLQEGKAYALAEYNINNHSVKVFEPQFKRLYCGGLVMAKMCELFNGSYPFSSVKLTSKPHGHTAAGEGTYDSYGLEA